jgi:Mg-chelatase subunit ChlD
VPVVACDLSIGAKVKLEPPELPDDNSLHRSSSPEHRLLDELLRRTSSRDTGQLWERLVESPAMLADPESIRQAALIFGWAVRESSPTVSMRDQLREAAMRECIRNSPAHCAAVIGSFHAGALIDEVVKREADNDQRLLAELPRSPNGVGVSLVPYSFEQLDERSGYPAGILDPVWHQRMVTAGNADAMDKAASEIIVAICRQMRRRGHVAGTPDASEIMRMMRDLARLRGLASPGRSELVESIQSCLVQGELHGRAREVSKASAHVLIGDRQGTVSRRVPRCGLAASLETLLESLNLPTQKTLGEQPREVRLDVLRSPRERAKAVVFRQMNAAAIPYAVRVDSVEQGQRENLAERWKVAWQQGTSATIEAVSRFGVTLPQVVEGILRGLSSDEILPASVVQQLEIATQCGLHDRVHQSLQALDETLLKTGGLVELVAAATILGRISAGHIPGLPRDDADAYPPILTVFHDADLSLQMAALLRACLDRLEGLEGSQDEADVMGVSDLVHWFNGDLRSVLESREASQMLGAGQVRLIHWCNRTLEHGSDLMRGAAAGMLCVLQQQTADQFAELLGGWFDAAVDRQSRNRLRSALTGSVSVLLAMMQGDAVWIEGLESRLRASSDGAFLQRLPSLRGAFHKFSPADRQRLLETRLQTYDERGSAFHGLTIDDSGDAGELVAMRREADSVGRQAVLAILPDFVFDLPNAIAPNQHNQSSRANDSLADDATNTNTESRISLADRWRMILGVPPENQPQCSGAASSLDQLFGRGRGEGSKGGLANRPASGTGGGTEAPTPTTAEWAEDLEELFGGDVCQEVLGESAGMGNQVALDLLDPDTVTPSIELLQQVLSLAGGLAEVRAERMRRLAKRITERLAKQLAVRLRPAMSGLSAPRPTRRRSRRLNLPRTIRDNLVNAYRRDDGRPAIVAKSLLFNTQSRREMDWHLTFVVDVSGSMTTSVVYSALCAAIFSELPALSVRFFAFSTEVLDLSDHVTDPLALLLEVQVGGGTHIGLGLRAARAKLKVPSRSIVVLVSDFEEGVSVGEMLAEVRALSQSGARCVGLAALDDSGTARFHQGYAQMVAAAGMPVAAVSPERLADWVGDQIRGQAGQSAKSPVGTLLS